jgi:hypothetical protein
MAIPLGEQYTPGHPVVKRTAIGQRFVGALVNLERRDRTKKGDDGVVRPVLKADGKPRKELIVTCLAMSGDAPAGIGDEQSIPEPGDTVRLILKGKAYADWIQAERALGRQVQVGDCVKQRTDSAQVYDADGNPKGQPLTTQAEVEAVPRSQTVGIYAELKLEPGEGEWIDKAEAAYRAATAVPLTAHQPAPQQQVEEEEPW